MNILCLKQNILIGQESFAIRASLNKWNIPNSAGKIEPNKIDELPFPGISGGSYNRNRRFNDSISYEDAPATKPVRHLLAIAAHSNGDKKINHALDDWYLANKKDFDVFAKNIHLMKN